MDSKTTFRVGQSVRFTPDNEYYPTSNGHQPKAIYKILDIKFDGLNEGAFINEDDSKARFYAYTRRLMPVTSNEGF